MPRIALCDDSEEDREGLAAMLREYARLKPGMSVSAFSSGEQLLCAEDGTDFDLYVLDVVMPEMSGIELGIRLRERGCRGIIIYLTNTPEFAVDSYEVRSFYYLLKPVQPARFFGVLDRALAEVKKEKAACVVVKTRDGLRLVRINEIVYVELVGHTARYHLSGGESIDSLTLRRAFRSEVETLLSCGEFILCGASFAVNLHYVAGVEKTALCLDDGDRIPLPRGLSAKIRRQWSDYWLGPEGGGQL